MGPEQDSSELLSCLYKCHFKISISYKTSGWPETSHGQSWASLVLCLSPNFSNFAEQPDLLKLEQ